MFQVPIRGKLQQPSLTKRFRSPQVGSALWSWALLCSCTVPLPVWWDGSCHLGWAPASLQHPASLWNSGGGALQVLESGPRKQHLSQWLWRCNVMLTVPQTEYCCWGRNSQQLGQDLTEIPRHWRLHFLFSRPIHDSVEWVCSLCEGVGKLLWKWPCAKAIK